MTRAREPIHVEPKGWGRELWIANSPFFCGKILEIKRGKKCSLHFHKLNGVLLPPAGHLRIRVKESHSDQKVEEFELRPGQCMDVPVGLVHQMEALEDSEVPGVFDPTLRQRFPPSRKRGIRKAHSRLSLSAAGGCRRPLINRHPTTRRSPIFRPLA